MKKKEKDRFIPCQVDPKKYSEGWDRIFGKKVIDNNLKKTKKKDNINEF